MSDITGSTGIGEGFTLAYDVNPTAETAMISLKYGPVTVSQATLTSSKLTHMHRGLQTVAAVLSICFGLWYAYATL